MAEMTSAHTQSTRTSECRQMTNLCHAMYIQYVRNASAGDYMQSNAKHHAAATTLYTTVGCLLVHISEFENQQIHKLKHHAKLQSLTSS